MESMHSLPLTFILKKVVSSFLQPLPLILMILAIGLILLWFTKRTRAVKVLVTAGTMLLLLLSSDLGPMLLVRPLEDMYQPFRPESAGNVKYVVVLSGGGVYRLDVPPGTMLHPHSTLGRLVEGISICRDNPGARLVLDGVRIPDTDVSEADVYAAIAVHYGIPAANIIKVTGVLDTSDEAEKIKEVVKDSPFALVTSALHMHRAVMMFRKQGMNPVPAPCAYLYGDVNHDVISMPDGGNLSSIDQAFHEYIGILWGRLCGSL